MPEGSPERLRTALESPVRRQILRTLHDSPVPLSGRQLLGTKGLGSNLSSITYHALVLVESGAVEAIPPAPGDAGRAFSSAVAEDERVATILAATAAADRKYLSDEPGERG